MAKATKGQSANEGSVEISERDVILLQMAPGIGPENLVFEEFSAAAKSRRKGTEWLAFSRSDAPHHMGKSEWLGLSKSVPLKVIDVIQAAIEAAGVDVDREIGRALQNQLVPFARLSDDGLEILVPAALAGSPGRVVPRGSARPTARGYVMGSSTGGSHQDPQDVSSPPPADNDQIQPDLGFRFYQAGHGNKVFAFSSLMFSLIARIGDGMYTAMANVTMEETYALSIDFDAASYRTLLGLLPGGAQEQLQAIFSGPFTEPQSVEVPQGAIVAGVRAKLGEPQSNDDETYVPFVALTFLPAAAVSSLSIEEPA